MARERLGHTGPIALSLRSYGTFFAAVRAGVGVGVLPTMLGEHEPGLVCVEADVPMPFSLWILTHPDLRTSPRVRAVMDGMYAYLKGH